MPPKFSKEIEEKIMFPNRLQFQPRTSPCEANCPAGNPIQKAQGLLKEGLAEEALAYIRSRNPFPGITGRVCSHPCEDQCNRGQYDERISIRSLERFASDHADPTTVIKPRKREATGKSIAVIGSGPAGMTCAYFSALFGHEVTVFESGPALGGIPRSCIPDFRLPKDIVDREVGQILGVGVHARVNTRVGRDITFEEILKQFDACLIAAGAWKERRMSVPGAELALTGMEFLRQVSLGGREAIGRKVVITGGGGVAFDCAFTARRLGASEVHVVCLEGEGNMCASAEDLLQAKAEGINVHHSRMISQILSGGGKPEGVEYFGIESFAFNEEGFLTVSPASGEREILTADTVISAVGVVPDLGFCGGEDRFKLTGRGTLEVDPETMATSMKGVFGAGDAATGPSTVAAAVGSGRKAAVAMDAFLNGKDSVNGVKIAVNNEGLITIEGYSPAPVPHVVVYDEIMNADSFEKKGRQKTEVLNPDVSVKSFVEIVKGFDREAVLAEAERCFHCGHCTKCGSCVENCPGFVLTMTPEGPQPTYYDECWHCGCCRIACPGGAVFYDFPINMLV